MRKKVNTLLNYKQTKYLIIPIGQTILSKPHYYQHQPHLPKIKVKKKVAQRLKANILSSEGEKQTNIYHRGSQHERAVTTGAEKS